MEQKPRLQYNIKLFKSFIQHGGSTTMPSLIIYDIMNGLVRKFSPQDMDNDKFFQSTMNMYLYLRYLQLIYQLSDL